MRTSQTTCIYKSSCQEPDTRKWGNHPVKQQYLLSSECLQANSECLGAKDLVIQRDWFLFSSPGTPCTKWHFLPIKQVLSVQTVGGRGLCQHPHVKTTLTNGITAMSFTVFLIILFGGSGYHLSTFLRLWLYCSITVFTEMSLDFIHKNSLWSKCSTSNRIWPGPWVHTWLTAAPHSDFESHG